MESGTTVYYELPGDYTHPPSPPDQSITDTALPPSIPLNFSRPRPPLHVRNNLSNATFPELQPSPVHILESKRVSKGDSCIAYSPDTETPHMSDDNETVDSGHDIDLDFGQLEEDDSDEAVPPPISKTSDMCLPSSPAIPANIMRWREPPIDPAAEYDMSDASSMMTTETDMTATTIDTVTADDASVKTIGSATFVFDGRLGWAPQASSHAEQERQRYAPPTPRRQHGSDGRSQIASVSSPTKAQPATIAVAGEKRRFLSKKRPPPVQTRAQPEQNTQLPTPPMIIKHTTVEQHTDPIEPIPVQPVDTPFKEHSGPFSFSEPSSAVSAAHSADSNKTSSISSVGSNSRDTMSSSGEWRASDHDITGLSEAQIKKLKRKGINPALYAEMQAARRSGPGGKKSIIGPLTGNSFIS